MRNFLGYISRVVVVAAVAASVAQLAHSQAKKNWKDQGEYDLFNSAGTAIGGGNFTKALSDLDNWKQKYPSSDFKDEGTVMYIQSYNGAKQPEKAVDTAGELLNKDLSSLAPNQVITVLFTTSAAVQAIQNPTPEQLAIGDKAAHQLMDYNKKPDGLSDAQWDTARTQLQGAAQNAMLYIALRPGRAAMAQKNCQVAEPAYVKALSDYPDRGQVAYEYGAALLTCERANPEKVSLALYEIARAVSLDPAKGGIADAKARSGIEAYLQKVYTTVHGSDEGLNDLKQSAASAATPASGFHIKTATEIADEKQKQFEASNPQLAMWMKIKGALADSNGDQYFSGQLKDSQLPKLKGTVVEGKCRAKEILVAVPLPDVQGTMQAEITLKLDAALTGKPEPNTEFEFDKAVPTAFSKEPFMLTMDVEKANLAGLKTSACAAAPAGKKGAPGRKKGF